MHMNKIRTTITIDKKLLDKAKHHRVSISSFLDIELRRYLALIEGKSTICDDDECEYRDLNPGKWLGKPLS